LIFNYLKKSYFLLTFIFFVIIFNHMVNYSTQSLDSIFSALSDPTRREILSILAREESTVSDIARPFKMSLPAVSKHLKVLERAGLIDRHKDGRIHRCRLEAEPLKEASSWITQYEHFWEEQLNALTDYLEQTPSNKEEKNENNNT